MPKSNDRIYRKTKQGRPYGSFYGWYYTLDGRRVTINLRTANRGAATRRLRELERAASGPDSAAYGEAASYPLVTAVEDFLTIGCASKAAGTARMYEQKARHLLRGLGYEADLAQLRLDDVERYVTLRRDEGAHASTRVQGDGHAAPGR